MMYNFVRGFAFFKLFKECRWKDPPQSHPKTLVMSLGLTSTALRVSKASEHLINSVSITMTLSLKMRIRYQITEPLSREIN